MARWNVNDIYQLFLKLSRRNQSGSFGSEDFFRLWNAEQSTYHESIVEGSNKGLLLNEETIQKLSPFIVPVPLTVANGVSDKPDDIVYRIGIRINGYNAMPINLGSIDHVNHSVIDAPSVTDNKYYYYETGTQFSFLPNTVTTATLDYVASCNDVKWGYTFDANGRQVYSAGTSSQPKWSTNTIIKITKRCFDNIGLSYKDRDFQSFGQQAKATAPD